MASASETRKQSLRLKNKKLPEVVVSEHSAVQTPKEDSIEKSYENSLNSKTDSETIVKASEQVETTEMREEPLEEVKQDEV